MPAFMALAIGESVLPKHAAQASADGGTLTTANAAAARMSFCNDFIES